ncbi:large-conductance mechanosensitive channel protein MscL [Bacteroides sedimenti]|uniref:Large-conductance mechanosensitive channel n=1 Tax=Bacteroides sedimenti TaxID=2136147 RepID=A0ABM8I7K8_9BACE
MGKSNFVQEFKAFALKGNVIDMAVGIIIGGAFGKIVSSLVADILMPAIGTLFGGANFTELKWVVKEAVYGADGKVITPASTLNYGNFIQTTIDFVIIAFVIFLFIKFFASLNRKKEEIPSEPPAPTKEEKLLTEIRDILKEK